MNHPKDIDIAPLPQALENALQRAMAPPGTTTVKDATYYKKKAKADNTYRSYASAINDFIKWTQLNNPFPTSTFLIEQYLTEKANETTSDANADVNGSTWKYAPTTLSHRLAALSWVHRMLGYDDPTQNTQVRTLLTGIRKDRIESGWQEEQAPALPLEAIRTMIQCMGETLREQRDKAFLLTSIICALRQSEAITLQFEQLTFDTKGIAIDLGKTKTDQTQMRKKYSVLPRVGGLFCPVTALETWLQAAEITEGAIFRGINRHGQFVTKKEKDEQGNVVNRIPVAMTHTTGNRIVKHWVNQAGIENASRYSGHSLRATFVTLARSLQIPDAIIARQTHHRNLNTLGVYDRPEQVFDNNAVDMIVRAFE